MARRRGLLVGLGPETSTLRLDPADPADRGRADPVAPADPRAETVAPADPADRAAPRAHPADPMAPVARAAPRARLVGHGMGIRSVATSTGPRGATDPHLGDRAHHRGRTGAGRSRRPGSTG
jgi:hypothetical protein